MKLTLVAAVAQNGVIGSRNDLPWYIPEDLKHFKQVTIGKTVLMGRKTFESIMNRLKKPLPDRLNVVITHQDLNVPEGVLLFHSLEEAFDFLKNKDEVLVAGGSQIFTETIDRADKLILTEVHKDYAGDVFFPKFDKNVWKEVLREDHLPEFSFVEYERK